MPNPSAIPHSGARPLRLEWLLRALLYGYAFDLFSYVTADPDLWGHLRFGRLTLEQGGVVRNDPFSFTAPGAPWINHEWLTEVLFYGIYSLAGSTGLLLFKTGIGVWIVHALFSLYRKRCANLLFPTVYAFLAIPVMAPGFMTRPHVLTFFFLTLLWVLLQEGLERNPGRLWWIPAVFLFWVNCHGGVVAGLGIFGVAAALEGLRRRRNRDPVWKTLLGAFLLSLVAVLINPYGWELWEFFIHTLSQPRDISEWQAVPLEGTAYLAFKGLALLFGLSLLLPVKKRVWEVAVILIALLFGFLHQRHTVLAAILLCPYLPRTFAEWRPRWDVTAGFQRAHADFRAVALAVLALGALLFGFHAYTKYRPMDFQIYVDPRVYPTHLAQFLSANGVDGTLWTPFDWGEYFIWKRPGSRVSVDGRFRTVYPEPLLNDAWAVASAQNGFEKILDRYAPRLVITRAREPAHQAMEGARGWVKIYQDPVSKLFVRPEDPLAGRFRAGTLRLPQEPPPDLFPG